MLKKARLTYATRQKTEAFGFGFYELCVFFFVIHFALGITAASFFEERKKDIAESPTEGNALKQSALNITSNFP